MTEEKNGKEERFERILRLFIGFILFLVLLYLNYHLDKEVNKWLYGIPGLLMGIDPSKLFKVGR